MVIRLTPDGLVVLDAPEEFKRFSIALPVGVEVAETALGLLVEADGSDHGWVAPADVAGLHPLGDTEWRGKLDAMVAYAASKGWTDGDGRLRAHIERS